MYGCILQIRLCIDFSKTASYEWCPLAYAAIQDHPGTRQIRMFKLVEDLPNQELNKRILPQEKPYLKTLVCKSKSSTLVNVQNLYGLQTRIKRDPKNCTAFAEQFTALLFTHSLHVR